MELMVNFYDNNDVCDPVSSEQIVLCGGGGSLATETYITSRGIRYTLLSHSNINLQYDLFIIQSKQLHAYNSCEFLSYLQTM